MSIIPSTIFVFDTRYATGTGNSKTWNTVPAGTVQPGTYSILSYHSINQLYNVETGVNDTVYFDEFASPGLTAVLDAGYYDESDLKDEIDAKMTTASLAGDVNVYTTVHNVNTGKYTTTSDNSTFFFTWLAQTQSANKLMGYDALDGTIALTQTSDNPIDIVLHTNLFLTVSADGIRNVTSLADPSIEYSLVFPLDQDYQTEIDSLKQRVFNQTVTIAASVNTLTIDTYTEDGTALVNNPDYILIIQKQF